MPVNDPRRFAALAAGQLTYMGKPCKHGHSGERYANGGACVECRAVQARKPEYLERNRASWARCHSTSEAREKERLRSAVRRQDPVYCEKYLSKHGPAKLARINERYKSDPEWRAAKLEHERKRLANPAARQKRIDYLAKRRENPDLFAADRASIRAYYRTDKGRAKAIAHSAKRYAAKLQATPAWADLEKIEEVYRERQHLEKETGVKYHVDHIVPLKGESVCGLHVEYNLRIIPAVDNIKKKNRFVIA